LQLNGEIKGQEEANIACCWALDAETQRPLLCVAGNDANITVHDVLAGTVLKVILSFFTPF
jgi:polycomb protein EED